MINHIKNIFFIILTLTSVVFAEPFDGAANTTVTALAASSEVEATRQIQEAVVNTPNLSVGGKNTIVNSHNGKIILRGSVASQQESQIIYELAKKNSNFPIDNQLTISK